MTPRTPQRAHQAEPFVTLLLSETRSSKLVSHLPGTQTPVSPAHVSPIKGKLKVSGTRSQTAADETTNAELTHIGATPLSQHDNSPNLSLPKSKIVTLKYSTPVNTKKSRSSATTIPTDPSGLLNQALSKATAKDDQQLSNGQGERRSSTASIADSVTRSSGRARKLTTKAQALAGSRFLPSLQNTPDPESMPNQTAIEAVRNQEAGNSDEKIQVTSENDTAETNVDEALIESVESPTVRTSRRERKPTARAIEIEASRATRKRPASPADSERASKMAKTSPSACAKPSKLRQSVMEEPSSPSKIVVVDSPSDDQQQDKEMKSVDAVEEVDQSPALQVLPVSDTRQDPQDSEPFVDKSMANTPESQAIQNTLEPSIPEHAVFEPLPASIPLPEPSRCDMVCLSPSSRLVALATIAADWSDSEDDSIDDDAEDEFGSELHLTSEDEPSERVAQVLQKYCACAKSRPLTKSSAAIEPTLSDPNASQVQRLGKVNPKKNSSHKKASIKDHPPASRRSTRERTQRVPMQLEVAPSPKRRKPSYNKPLLQRQNSSYEQRMKDDYLASQQDQKMKPQDASQTDNGDHPSLPALTTFSAAATFSPQPIRFDVNAVSRPDQALYQNEISEGIAYPLPTNWYGPHSDDSMESDEVNKINNSTKPLNKILSGYQNQISRPATSFKSGAKAKVVGKSTRSGKAGINGGTNTSKGGPAKIPSRGVPGVEEESMVQPHPVIAPSQSTGIKLRFTTAAK